jgi:hypothetical protein
MQRPKQRAKKANNRLKLAWSLSRAEVAVRALDNDSTAENRRRDLAAAGLAFERDEGTRLIR